MEAKGRKLYFRLTILIALGMLLSGCGYHYKCNVTFGASNCTPTGTGIGTTGGSGNKAFVYNVLGSGSVNGISLATGTSTTLQNISGFSAPSVPGNEESAEIVVVPKKYVYAMFPVSHLLFAWSINASNGDLTAISGSPYTIASLGSVIANSAGVNLSSMAVNPAGTFLFIAYAGSAQIDAYQIGSGGALTQVSGAPFSTSGVISPWNLYFDGLGKYLYATTGSEGLGQVVAAYSIASSGALTLVPGSPFAFNMWQLQGDPSGKFMIGISGRSSTLNGLPSDTSLYVFSIQQSGANAGALTQVSGSPFTTLYAPINLAVQPVATNGNFVYSFSGTESPLEGYQLDTTSGALTVMPTSPFTTIGTSPWGQFDQSGAYLLIFAVTNTTASLGAFTVDTTTGDLSEPISPLPVDLTTTYFTVTDAP